jgi:hypothetical protein
MTFKQSHIHLIGNSEENFYILGKRDKDAFEAIYKQISMLCARNNILAKSIKIATEISGRFHKREGNQQVADLKAYAQGLERPYDDVFFTLLLPEIVASFNKWIPDLLSIIPGCSSLFIWDKINKGVVHSRILDYALSGPFEAEERSILYELPGCHKVLSFGSAGMPLASLSAMNDKGLTMALHYKHGSHFNLEGESIFMLANNVIQNCSNIREALKYIKSKKSISYWGMYLSDINGEVLSLDICGDEIYQEKFDLRDHEYLYFNNRPLLKKSEFSKLRPHGNLDQCRMRRETIKKRIQKESLIDSKDILLDSLKLIAKPEIKKAKTAKNWKLSPITPSSIQTCSFHNSLQKSLFIPGPSPKYYLNSYIEYKNIFTSIDIKTKSSKKEINEFIKAQRYLSQFQSSIDLGDVSIAYHKIQMAIELLKNYPECYIAKFYFLITQYIYESDKRDLTYLYTEFKELDGLLPSYLNDHRQLFVLRLGKLIGHQVENQSQKIIHEDLRSVYLHEYKLNTIAIKGLKKLIFPRIEILDIIYAY